MVKILSKLISMFKTYLGWFSILPFHLKGCQCTRRSYYIMWKKCFFATWTVCPPLKVYVDPHKHLLSTIFIHSSFLSFSLSTLFFLTTASAPSCSFAASCPTAYSKQLGYQASCQWSVGRMWWLAVAKMWMVFQEKSSGESAMYI